MLSPHAAHEPARRAADRGLRLPVRHRLVAAHRRDRLVVQSDLRHDGGDAAAHLPGLPVVGWTGRAITSPRCRWARIVCIAASNGGTTSQDLKTGFLVGATPRLQQIAILIGALASALVLGPILLKLNDSGTVYVPVAQVARGLQRRRRALLDAAAGLAAARRPSTDNAELPRLAQDATRSAGRRASTWWTTQGAAVWLGRPGHQRHSPRRGPTAPRCGSSTRPRPR